VSLSSAFQFFYFLTFPELHPIFELRFQCFGIQADDFLGKRFASIFSGFFSLEVLICIPIKYGAESFSRLLNAHLYFQLLDRASHDGSEQSISVKFSSRTMGVRFPQADRQLDVKVDETTSSECVPTKITESKATSFLCLCVFTYEGGLV